MIVDSGPAPATHPVGRLALVMAVVAATASTGCSFLFARKPAGNAQSLDYPPDCTWDRELPVVDLLGAAAMGILGAANLHAQLNDRGAFFVGSPGLTIISFGHAAGYGASAAYGFAITSRCREARARWLEQRGYLEPRAAGTWDGLELSNPPGMGTMVLIWHNPSPRMKIEYGAGDSSRRTEQPPPSIDGARHTRAATVELPLPVGAGMLWYRLSDKRRPQETWSMTSRNYHCPPGGKLTVELWTEMGPYQGYPGHEWIHASATLWQEGCRFPDDPLALTRPAVATVSVRSKNLSPGVDLTVSSDRTRANLPAMPASPSRPGRISVQSGAGKLSYAVSDPSHRVGAVYTHRYHCRDGGHLEVEVTAAIVDGRPSLKADYSGKGCRHTDGGDTACQFTSGEGFIDCLPNPPAPLCCGDGPGAPWEE